MFPWNIAKSAEAMFSSWALKRVCKFMLKKKLGQFILGDIDLDQLDVQLSRGTIQLSDLALNVDYINTKLGKATSLVVKEGSIGHLLVKMPWSGKGCQVEVDELELVISPCVDKIPMGSNETCSFDDNDNYLKHISTRTEHDAADDAQRSASMDVHEGVKTIAKMVKWLLTSFHVKIANVIIAFDPSVVREEKKTLCDRNLVLRISEIECGTRISEDADSSADVFGISCLTNFVKFQGAIIELLELDNDGSQVSVPHVSGEGCNEPVLVSKRATHPIMTGDESGFGGSIKLSIPWKNGSLDIHKVDADVSVDPIVLRFQPSTIKWLLWSLDSCRNLEDGIGCMNNNLTASVLLNSASSCHSSMSVPVSNGTNELLPVHGSSKADLSSPQSELLTEALLPGSRLISDWVPWSTDRNHKDGIQDLDFGASVDQFFECIDGMRSFQSALGSSGMWNWTCSVFTAITAASSLASGSLHNPIEQQHVEANLRATFAGISVVLSFCSEEEQQSCDPGTDSVVGFNVDYLGAECNEILFCLQVCSQAITVEGTVKHIEITEFLNMGIDSLNSDLEVRNNAKNKTALVRDLQAEIIGALPSSSSYDIYSDLDSLSRPVATDFLLGNNNSLMRVTLFGTSGVTHCKFTAQSNCVDHNLMGTKSFSVNLPPFIFWVIFPVIDMFMNLLKEIGKPVQERNGTKEVRPKASDQNIESSLGDDGKRSSSPCVKSLSPTEHLHGDVSISSAKVILCFPFERGGDHTNFFWWEQFIALDFSSPLNKGPACSTAVPNARLKKRCPSVLAQSLQLNICDLDMYLITSSNGSGRMSSHSRQSDRFSANHFLSIASRMDCYSVISVIWQVGQVTGLWMAEKARSLAKSEHLKGSDDFVGKGYEFASASTVKDLEDLKSQTKQEFILSSSLFLHFHLPQVMINLSDSQYKGIHCLLTQMMNALVCATPQAASNEKEFSVSQSSTLIECESLEILIRPDTSESIRSSMQSELPGYWNQLKLRVQKFELQSVTNTGGIKSVDFLRIAHGEGKLWGLITGVPDREFLLITCSNSTAKRGDGGGSNPLSSGNAGLEIIHLSDQEVSQNTMSITVSCGTIVAVGGRLDWFNTIPSFFSLPSSDTEESGGNHKSRREMNGSSTAFILHLIDIALSYEPYTKKLVVQTDPISLESGFSHVGEDIGEQCVSCLLAASSLTLSSSTTEDSVDNVYRITVKDLGFLLHVVSESNSYGTYSVEHLKETGYAKVAQEALMKAVLKINSASGFPWQLELSKSHICLETCHDTTASLIRLATQLQQLFAPDVEESIVHLQNRWENSLQAQQSNGFHNERGNASFDTMASTSCQCPSETFSKDQSSKVGLMDEISDDAFEVSSNNTWQFYSSELGVCMPLDGNFVEGASTMSINEPEVLYHDLHLPDSVPLIVPEGGQASFVQEGCFPGIIEEYMLSDLCPLSELSVGKHSDDLCRHRLKNVDKEIERESGPSGGWYSGNSLKVLENHISKECEQTGLETSADSMSSSCDSLLHNEPCGRVILEKIDIRWRIYGGSDWLDSMEKGPHSERDTDVSLELALSGMKYQYDIFPVGDVRVSKMSVSVQDFRLYDRSRNAPWKLVLKCYYSKGHPKESSSKAFKLDLESVRPDPLTPLEEYRLNIALLPIQLHLHQSQLDFLINFFGRTSSLSDQPPTQGQESKGSQGLPEKSEDLQHHTVAREALLPYFQKFNISPILVRVDYHPHHVNLAALRHGKYVELVNIIPWKGIELNLKHVHAAGIYGWGSVCETIVGEWLEDVSQNQIHKILQGLPPVRSLISVGAGATKLVSSPVENYRKERKVLKGVQRGTIAFLRSISLEAVGLGVHLAAGAHDILLQAEYILGSTPPEPRPVKDKSQTDVRSNQPKDAQQGIQQACESLSNGLGKSAAVLVQNPLKKYQCGAGTGPALAAAVRAFPVAAIAPASACASAAHCALLGIRNSLDPERKRESMEKHCPTELWEED